MSELKHTKSPWLIADDDPTFVYALGPHGTNLFWVPVQASGPEKIGREEAIANARLIAAAPDLLATLEALMLAAENLDPQSGAPIGYDELLKAIGAADAVRQKARGAA